MPLEPWKKLILGGAHGSKASVGTGKHCTAMGTTFLDSPEAGLQYKALEPRGCPGGYGVMTLEPCLEPSSYAWNWRFQGHCGTGKAAMTMKPGASCSPE